MESPEDVLAEISKSPALVTLYMKDGTVRAVLSGDKELIKVMIESVNDYLNIGDSPFNFHPIGEA
jgi:hypothetical protein